MAPAFSVSELSNRALLDEAVRLVADERGCAVSLIITLSEIDSRRLYLSEGHSCMFHYCTNTLHLSESASYRRIEVARVSRAFPEILTALGCGALNVSTAVVIAPHLTFDNVDELIAAASFKRKKDVERLVAERHPKPDVATVVRRQPETRRPVAAREDGPIVAAVPLPPAKPAIVAPLSAARYKIQFTAVQDTHDKLRHAQALLRHQIPSGDVDAIVNKALTLLIADVERKKLGFVTRPRRAPSKSAAGSRHIPAAVRRQVATRDKGQCAFVGRQGRCSERGRLEFHHVVPFAAAGAATVDNIQLRCRAHNAHEAVLYFGEEALPAGARACLHRAHAESGRASARAPKMRPWAK